MALFTRSALPRRTIAARVADRQISITLSPAAAQGLATRTTPLVAEAEIMFSCLIGKRLIFRDASPDLLSWPVHDSLHVAVRPVRYELCHPDGGGTVPAEVEFAVADLIGLLPASFDIDVADTEWTGSFSFLHS